MRIIKPSLRIDNRKEFWRVKIYSRIENTIQWGIHKRMIFAIPINAYVTISLLTGAPYCILTRYRILKISFKVILSSLNSDTMRGEKFYP